MSTLTTDPRKREFFMGIVHKPGEPEQSYEEVRINDYIHAYRTTGRPPQPCAQIPANPEQRKALGLPPLFQPHVVDAPRATTSFTPITPPVLPSLRPNVVDPNAIPDTQVFQPTVTIPDSRVAAPETSQSIVSQSLYSNFSFEELRCLAYRRGKKVAPEALVPAAPAPAPSITLSLPRISTPTLSGSFSTSGDKYQSISCQHPYLKHSPEELRIAFTKTGRELTSEEIIRQNAVLRMS